MIYLIIYLIGIIPSYYISRRILNVKGEGRDWSDIFGIFAISIIWFFLYLV